MMTTNLINKVKQTQSKKEIRKLLHHISSELQHSIVSNAISILNAEIECDISLNNTSIALYKMSQVVVLEDEKHIIERTIFKQRVLV